MNVMSMIFFTGISYAKPKIFFFALPGIYSVHNLCCPNRRLLFRSHYCFRIIYSCEENERASPLHCIYCQNINDLLSLDLFITSDSSTAPRIHDLDSIFIFATCFIFDWRIILATIRYCCKFEHFNLCVNLTGITCRNRLRMCLLDTGWNIFSIWYN